MAAHGGLKRKRCPESRGKRFTLVASLVVVVRDPYTALFFVVGGGAVTADCGASDGAICGATFSLQETPASRSEARRGGAPSCFFHE